MARWPWLFLAVFAVAGLLASDRRVAVQNRRDCCSGITGAPLDQRQHGTHRDHARLPGYCAVGLCACPVVPPFPLRIGALRPVSFSLVDFVAPQHGNSRVGQSRPPDLRPPIA